MPGNPATYASVLSADFVRASARARRRRERVISAVVGICTAVVLLGLLAIPLFRPAVPQLALDDDSASPL